MSELPNGWAKTSLGDIRLEKFGAVDPLKTPDRQFELYSVPAFPSGRPEVIPGREIGSTKQAVVPGTVLVCKINPRINRAWVVADFSEHPKLASTEWIAFPPLEGLDATYLAYFFRQDRFRDFLAANVSGVGGSLMRARVNALDAYEMRIPPSKEQVRISEKLDELMSDLDAGHLALERARTNLMRYRATVLKAAVEGRLTEKWRAAHPDVEPASKLLERILAERRKKWEEVQLRKYADKGQSPPKGWKEKYSEPEKPDLAELPDLPTGWCWATIDQLSSEVRNGSARAPREGAVGHRILRINAVRPMSVDLEETRLVDLPEEEVEDATIRNADLLFTRYNGSPELVGVSGLVRNLEGEILHPDKLIRVRVVMSGTLAEFLEMASNVGSSREHIRRRTRTTAGQAGVSGSDIKQTPIPLPAEPEMVEIMAEVNRVLSLVRSAEDQVSRELRRAPRLRQAVLKRAFEGKLVPQDPKDEPASKLLARIREQREAGPATARKRSRVRAA